MPLDVSEDGEAANAEIGLLLGLTGGLLIGDSANDSRARPEQLVMLGPRDDLATAVQCRLARDQGCGWFRR